jgi:glycosyltransferase involved in cell wall biosynthesis
LTNDATALSIVVPAYNEAKNLPLLVARIDQAFGSRSDVEVVVVDNGSVDATPRQLPELLAGRPGVRSVRVERNQGYGFGILSGLKAARGRVLAWTHADMQTDIADALRGFEFFAAAREPERLFVKGRRHGRPAGDVVFTVGMAAIETVLLGTPLWDINAQPTMFPRTFFESWNDPPWDFSLDLYAYGLAKKRGFAIARFPVRFGDRAHGASHWNIDFGSKIKMIRRTLGYSFELSRRLSRTS